MRETGKAASREDFFKHAEVRYEPATLPEIGDVVLKSMTDAEARRAALEPGEDPGYLWADYAIACICSKDNLQMFGESDRDKLAAMDSSITRPAMAQILKHCRLGQWAVDFDDAKKN